MFSNGNLGKSLKDKGWDYEKPQQERQSGTGQRNVCVMTCLIGLVKLGVCHACNTCLKGITRNVMKNCNKLKFWVGLFFVFFIIKARNFICIFTEYKLLRTIYYLFFVDCIIDYKCKKSHQKHFNIYPNLNRYSGLTNENKFSVL